MKKFVAYVIVAIAFLIIYGSAAFSLISNVEYEITPSLLLTSLIFNFIIMFLPAILFVYLVYGNIWEKLYFKKEGVLLSFIYGLATALIFIISSGMILYLIGYEEKNPLAEEIGRNINFAFLFLIPLLSAISEETFFRGFIQMQLEARSGFLFSLLLSSLLFAFAHLEYRTYMQVIMPFFFGILLGILMHRTKNIFAPIFAHFFYNFLSLVILLYS